jgi:hypothetical protein
MQHSCNQCLPTSHTSCTAAIVKCVEWGSYSLSHHAYLSGALTFASGLGTQTTDHDGEIIVVYLSSICPALKNAADGWVAAASQTHDAAHCC